MDTGFNYYHGADPSEYDLVVSNSEGGLERLRELGARRAEAVFWGADPEFFAPQPVEKEHDVFFYGYGDKFRRDWMAAMVGEPSRARCPSVEFALGGRDFQGDIGRARLIGDVPFNVFARAISAARINLNITRRSHATVYASSSCRPFELAAAGAAIVSNPYEGIERWFEPGSELLVVDDADEALARLPRAARRSRRRPRRWARRARERVLDEHTYAHRARQLLELVGLGTRRGGSAPCAELATLADRDRPGLQRGGGDRRACVDELRAFDPGLDVVVVDDGSTDRTAERRRGRAARASSGCRSTSASAAPSRPASGTRSSTATTRRPRSTATASTTRRSSPSLLAPVLERGEADIVVGSRFAGGDGDYRPPLARRVGIRCFARVVSLLARQKRDRHDVRLPGAEPPRDRALRRRLPARLPRGRGGRDGRPPPRCASSRCRCAMREREHGRSSITALALGLLHGQGDCSRSSSASSAARVVPLEEADSDAAPASRSRRRSRRSCCMLVVLRADPQSRGCASATRCSGSRPASCCSCSRPGAAA